MVSISRSIAKASVYAKEGVDLSLSTLADLVGACTVVLRPLHELIEAHVLKADRLHADDTPIRVLAKGKCAKATAWAYVRDDRPFGGPDPPAVLFHYSRNRKGEHPTRHLADFAGVLQADAYSGFNPLLDPKREAGPITPALCWSHSRRKFFELADLKKQARSKNQLVISPMALEAVKRIDALFDIERAINGRSAEERPKGAQGKERAFGGRVGKLDARGARQALQTCRRRQGDGLYAETLGRLCPLSRKTAGSA